MSLRTDRVAGAMLGLAAGDALGAGYEFATPPTGEVAMVGGGLGGWEPGEWTDDTQMAICIAEVTARGSVDVDAIATRFLEWFDSRPADVGIATSAVLRAAAGSDLPPAEALREAATAYLDNHPKGGAGNGALMRTAPLALAHLGDDAAMAASARAVAELTHADPLAGDSCVLWTIAIDRAIRESRLDGAHDGLALLPLERQAQWRTWLEEAETQDPSAFRPNGFTVAALQAAQAAVTQTPVPDDGPAARHLTDALHAAVRIGHDTDTVAAIAGALLGARWGATAVPFAWRRLLQGWPGRRGADLVRLAVLTAWQGEPDDIGWPVAEVIREDEPAMVQSCPGDDGLLLGNLAALPEVVGKVDAVVSLCRVGTEQVPPDVEHHEVILTDGDSPEDNPNLELVLADTAEALLTLRDEGKRVFVHCVHGRSRTPAVVALMLARRDGISGSEAWDRITEVLPVSDHNEAFQTLLARVPAAEATAAEAIGPGTDPDET